VLLMSGAAFFFWQKSSAASSENNHLAAEMQALELEKSVIERNLDTMTVAYHNLKLENEGLRGMAASSTELVASKDAAIKKIKAQSRKELAELRQQVEALRKLEIEYQTIIATVKGENEQLREENLRLTGENAQLRDANTTLNDQMQDLAKQLEEQMHKTQSARFKATSFRVEVVRKSEKLTTRAKKAREILVSFDLADVPEAYRGAQKIYLSVTDDRGRPVASANPTKATVQAPTGPVAVLAQQAKLVSLNETQRLSFSHKFDDRLASGNYVAAIYCDFGLLGAASFRLS